MKKILLIGELNKVLKSIAFFLKDDYGVQICVNNLEVIRGTINIVAPDLILFCDFDEGEIAGDVMEYFRGKSDKIPVLILSVPSNFSPYKEWIKEGRLEVLYKPIKRNELLEKCHGILGINKVADTEKKSEAVKEATKERSSLNNSEVPEGDSCESQPATEESGRRRRILIVDDSPMILRNIKSMLDEKYDVSVSTSGKKALLSIKCNRPDLVLLDIEMPEMDGSVCFDKIKEIKGCEKLPIIFLTSVSDKDNILKVLAKGPEGYLLKPVSTEKLRSKIREVLDKI